ncbi:hypothetical protein FDA94_03280 [Herbidospora galbida]|uniref:Uncharacterized protein n=1 Tax=Herbidospora galbida TaxID=2575442 RepID=A0A4U3MMQ4_9ACTN|nr:hypothetical protein FDA94_03280 [Herbidospora galbida]
MRTQHGAQPGGFLVNDRRLDVQVGAGQAGVEDHDAAGPAGQGQGGRDGVVDEVVHVGVDAEAVQVVVQGVGGGAGAFEGAGRDEHGRRPAVDGVDEDAFGHGVALDHDRLATG